MFLPPESTTPTPLAEPEPDRASFVLKMSPTSFGLARRTRVACELCRKRKRRCNGASPCHLCRSVGADCHYKHRTSAPDIRALTKRVESIEKGLPAQEPETISPTDTPYNCVCHCAALSIPRAHATTTASLLSMPEVQALLGIFPPGLFVDREVSSVSLLSGSIPLPAITPDLDNLVEAFFTYVHVETPILDEPAFRAIYIAAKRNEVSDEIASALIFVVLSLGAAVTAGASELAVAGEMYISPALSILSRYYLASWQGDIALAQSLLLAARLFGYRMRPFQAWKLVHMASTSVQQYLFYIRGPPSTDVALLVWAIFDMESDLVAEHDLPRSGIEQLVETIALPYRPVENSRATLGWLAELSIRRLLNRVHGCLYGESTHLLSRFEAIDDLRQAVADMLRTSAELSRQLDSWAALLPSDIKLRGIIDDDVGEEMLDVHSLNAQIRYHSARDIIFRPFVIYACRYVNEMQFSLPIRQRCELWIANCRAFIRIFMQRLRWPSYFREIIMKSMLANVVILTLAALSPLLGDQVSDIETVQDEALTTIYEYAIDGSCGPDLISILHSLQEKTRIIKKIP